MANLLEQVTNALFGAARGVAAGSGGLAPTGEAMGGGAATRSSRHYQEVFRQEAARQQALYAQAQANSTHSVSAFYPQWMEAPQWVRQAVREIHEGEQAKSVEPPTAKVVTPVHARSDSAYQPVALETHEDFAAKLAARPEVDHGTKTR